jgi:ribonuclease HI
MSIPKVELYSDWWANPNPGPGWYWIVMKYKSITKEFLQWFTKTTNNRMELSGVINGLKNLKTKSDVNVFTDSQYTINWIEKWWAKKWKENNWLRTKSEKAMNYDLWEILLDLVEKHNVKFNWVKWHNWHIENERCDELATQAMNMDILLEDKFYLNNYNSEKQLPIHKNHKSGIVWTNKNIIKIEWDICWKCNTAVIKKIPKKKKFKPSQTFYYEYFFNCPWCKTNYMIPEWKRQIN